MVSIVALDEEAQLRQFEVLWAEIARRSNAQQAIIGATVTVTGTVGGLVVSGKAEQLLLVVLAIVAPVFGLLWLDHARNIGEIGNFIREKWTWTPNWEQENADRKATGAGRFRFVIFVTAVTIVFLGPAIVGLSASACHLDAQLRFILSWGGSATLTALFALSWGIQIKQSWSESSTQDIL